MEDREREQIRRIVHTLNTVAVTGADNMDKLLGCILVLKILAADKDGEETDR